MLFISAHNLTGTKADGTSDYDVSIRITDSPNSFSVLGHFRLSGHLRSSGGPELLRKIASHWERLETDQEPEKGGAKQISRARRPRIGGGAGQRSNS